MNTNKPLWMRMSWSNTNFSVSTVEGQLDVRALLFVPRRVLRLFDLSEVAHLYARPAWGYFI